MIMIDQHKKHFPRIPRRNQFAENFISTMSSFMMLLVLVSLMGWCAIEPTPAPRPYLSYPDKDALKRYTAENLAKHTYQYNSMMEARGLVHDVKKVR